MDSYISKPLDVRELIEQLQKFANAAQQEVLVQGAPNDPTYTANSGLTCSR